MPRRRGRPGLVGTMARTAVITGTASAVSGSVAQRQHARAQVAQQHGSTAGPVASEPPAPSSAAPPPPQPPSTTEPIIAELERLVELKQQGLLTDDEFSALKARLLAR